MSRHIVHLPVMNSGARRTVIAGFERQTQRCIIQIHVQGKLVPFQNIYFDPQRSQAKKLVAELRSIGLEVPLRMFEEILADAKQNVGNRLVSWTPRGVIREDIRLTGQTWCSVLPTQPAAN